MDEMAVRLRGVTRRYRHFSLESVDLDVAHGRVLGVVGQNGAGKSTLLRIMMGLVRAEAGTVEVLGQAMPANERMIKGKVGFVSEDMALYRGATLRWHMDLVRSFYPGWDEAHAVALLERFELNPSQKMDGVSRGQQVKAMLLLALARRPVLLVLDEPTAGLDPLVRLDVLRELAAARGDGRTVIFSSHRGDDIAGLADDVAFIHAGRLVGVGPAAAFAGGGREIEEAFVDQVRGVEAGTAA
jgi:ABC-2 type transport system ATP-binding protein